MSARLLDGPESLGTGVYTMRCATPLDPIGPTQCETTWPRSAGTSRGTAWPGPGRSVWRSAGCSGSGSDPAARPAHPGATVDWWEVVRADPDHLVLASFGWFCGDGWLGWRVTDAPSRVEQAAAFRPKGLLGLAYWWALWPVHQVVFRVMVRSRVNRVNWTHRVRPARWSRRRIGPGAATARNSSSVPTIPSS